MARRAQPGSGGPRVVDHVGALRPRRAGGRDGRSVDGFEAGHQGEQPREPGQERHDDEHGEHDLISPSALLLRGRLRCQARAHEAFR